MAKFEIGDRVMLTAMFLRSTGQVVGGEGFSRWTVVGCDCASCATGRFVAVNEPSAGDPTRPRHFNVFNLIREGKLDPS